MLKSHYTKGVTGILLVLFIVAVVAVPAVAVGQEEPTGLVPCGGTGNDPCEFSDLIVLAQRIIQFLIVISVPIAAGLFSYAGYLYITAAGNPGQVSKAHNVFISVVIGFMIVLGAWLLVYTLANTLFKTGEGGVDLLLIK